MPQLTVICRVRKYLNREISTATLVDLALMKCCENVENRYAILAESSIQARVDYLHHLLHRTRKTLELAQRFRQSAEAEGSPLN